MMAGSLEQQMLVVEGENDKHVLRHLLLRHGIDLDGTPRSPSHPKLVAANGIELLLRNMARDVKLSNSRAVGFVLDADSPLVHRWAAVRERLKEAGIQTPKMPPPEGFIGYSDEFDATAGVWLMPDNQHDGKLETFLRELIEGKDGLIGHAETATAEATTHGAAFSEADAPKAVLHAWLAWQQEPGCPYGTAIRAKYFRHDSPAAEAFVSWFKRLFGLD